MNIAITVILLIIGILFVIYPLLRPLRIKDENGINDQLHVRNSNIREILDELETDHEMGQLSDEDYQELDAKYRAELN